MFSLHSSRNTCEITCTHIIWCHFEFVYCFTTFRMEQVGLRKGDGIRKHRKLCILKLIPHLPERNFGVSPCTFCPLRLKVYCLL